MVHKFIFPADDAITIRWIFQIQTTNRFPIDRWTKNDTHFPNKIDASKRELKMGRCFCWKFQLNSAMMLLRKSKSKEVENPYSFQERFQNIQRIVIIYPQKTEWLRIARYALQRMYNLPERFDFLLLVPPENSNSDLNIKHEYAEMVYAPRSEDRIRLQNRIVGFNPDILLQLEPEPGDRMNKVIQSLDIALKIGFGDEKSGLNVIYSQKESGFYEKNILNLIALLEMK